jgi:hypothetical protein
MAKLSIKMREDKREKLVAKFAKKYAEQSVLMRSDMLLALSCKSCRVTPIRLAFATVVLSPVEVEAPSACSAWPATRFVSLLSGATSLAW